MAASSAVKNAWVEGLQEIPCASLHVCVCVQRHEYTQTCDRVCIHTNTYLGMHLYVSMYMCIHKRAHVYKYCIVYKYIYIYESLMRKVYTENIEQVIQTLEIAQ